MIPVRTMIHSFIGVILYLYLLTVCTNRDKVGTGTRYEHTSNTVGLRVRY
jgi:hypothetical protein